MALETIRKEQVGTDYYTWISVTDYSREVDRAAAAERKAKEAATIAQSVIDYNVMMGNLEDPEQEENQNG